MAWVITLLTALIALMLSLLTEKQHFAATWLEGPPAA
jgi:ABC-type phosphate/phosphonate transport system permease subunit